MADPILLDEQTELAPWVPASMLPLRSGVFQVHETVRNPDAVWFSHWDGVRWHGAWSSAEEASEHMDFPTAGSVSSTWEWRGLASNPLEHPI